jgi:hypothetical protein
MCDLPNAEVTLNKLTHKNTQGIIRTTMLQLTGLNGWNVLVFDELTCGNDTPNLIYNRTSRCSPLLCLAAPGASMGSPDCKAGRHFYKAEANSSCRDLYYVPYGDFRTTENTRKV